MILKKVISCTLILMVSHGTLYTTNIELYNSLSTSVFYCVSSNTSDVQGAIFKELASQCTIAKSFDTQECTIATSLEAPVTGTQITLFTIQINPTISSVQLKIHSRKNNTISIIPDRRSTITMDTQGISHRDIIMHYISYKTPPAEQKIEIPTAQPIVELHETSQITKQPVQQHEQQDDAIPVKIIEKESSETLTVNTEIQEACCTQPDISSSNIDHL